MASAGCGSRATYPMYRRRPLREDSPSERSHRPLVRLRLSAVRHAPDALGRPASGPVGVRGAQGRFFTRPAHWSVAQPDDWLRIQAALAEAGGNKSRAAQMLGLRLRQFNDRLAKLPAS